VALALYDELVGHVPPGATMLLLGSTLEFGFDPGMTVIRGGVHFGTTSADPGGEVKGSITFAP